MNALRFPSPWDIQATLGGTITRCGNKVLWTPKHRSQVWQVEPGLAGGFRLKPFWEKPKNEMDTKENSDNLE